MNPCPLCHSMATQFYYKDRKRKYLSCARCRLVFVTPEYHLNTADEKKEYDKHQNSPEDMGYCKFLNRLVVPLQQRLSENAHGLDYGCGPGPATPVLFKDKEFRLDLYDPLYANRKALLKQSYDFVVATEVVEHFKSPAQSWRELFQCVKLGGVLGVMTKLVIDIDRFQRWHYKNDPTHISFYSLATLQWIADFWQVKLEQVADDAFLFSVE